MSSSASSRLSRIWKSWPLLRLHQGSTLTIRSSLPRTHIKLQSLQWREDGLAELESKKSGVEMTVRDLSDKMTSMGRTAPHTLIELSSHANQEENVLPAKRATENDEASLSLPHTVSKSIDRVMMDDGTVVADSEEFRQPAEGMRRVEYHDGIAHLTTRNQNPTSQDLLPDGVHLTVQVPEKVNIECHLEGADSSIVIPSKVEGDMTLHAFDGAVRVKKLRGHVIDVQSHHFYCEELLEAQKLQIKTSGRVRAKQMHGNHIDIQVQRTTTAGPEVDLVFDVDDDASMVDISALYVSGRGGATVQVGPCQPRRRAVRVNTNQGPLRVVSNGLQRPMSYNEMSESIYPLVELGGVNGNCEVSVENTVSIGNENEENSDWASCLVHFDSLIPSSVSLITADKGDIGITLDRKIEADIRLLSLSSDESLTEAGALLAEEEDSALIGKVLTNLNHNVENKKQQERQASSMISIETKAFSTEHQGITTSNVEYMEGSVSNKSHEPDSRFEKKVKGAAVGKIRLESAAEQALHEFTDETDDTDLNPLVAVAGTARIRLETVSWLGAIARRYGMEETNRQLGRTASRKGRPLTSQ